MTRHIARSILALPLLLGIIGLATSGQARAAGASVAVLPAGGVVDHVLAGYLEEGIAKAAATGATAVVVTLNTPGGSLDATQRIVSALLDAPIPTIVWVSPSGARAASAGTFITLAAHVAVMAPGTNIGAASPVGGGGEDIGGTLGDKVRNDAIANIRSIAEARGRNVAWAEETVADARSSSASEALAVGAVDGIAGSLAEVLEFADGRVVTIEGRSVTIASAGAATSELAMNPAQAFLHLLSDPNIAFILFTVGFYGLFFELQNPNFVTGILGAIALILAFIGFGSLPLNVAALLLIGLAIVLFALEFTVTSHGLLTVGGIVCFVLGASALYTEPGTPTGPVIAVDPRIIVGVTAATAAYVVAMLWVVVRWRRAAGPIAGVTGPMILTGGIGEVRSGLGPLGVVYAAGEEWTARTESGAEVPPGTTVRITRQDGLTLIVEPIDQGV